MTLGAQIDEIYGLQQAKKIADAGAKKLADEIAIKEAALFLALDAIGTTAGRGKLASAGISESVVFNADNWETFNAYVRRNNKFELYQRRLALLACRELAGQRKDHAIPGLVPFPKRVLNVTKVS